METGTENLLREVVCDYVGKGRMFTALDISREVQSIAKKQGLPHYRHNEIKDWIHIEMSKYNSYTRTLCDVGAPTKAFVYHLYSDDSSLYVGQPRNDNQIPSVVNDGKKPDSRGTLCISNNLVNGARLSSGDTALVWMEGNDLYVGKSLPVGKNAITQYTVDCHGNVRITKHALEVAGFGNVKSFKFEGNSNFVKVNDAKIP